jgi:molecular chaperone GrpE
MSRKKSLLNRMNDFFFGQPVPVLSEADREMVRDLHQKLDVVSGLLDGAKAPPPNGQPAEGATGEPDQAADLVEQVRKLAKTQFKTNALQEAQLTQQQAALESLQKSVEQHEKLLLELAKERDQALINARLELLRALLPVLDSLDAAFNSGRRQVLRLALNGEVRQAVIGWLDGIRLARLRLLDLLAAHEVRPIPTVGQSFDPHYHIAVAIDNSGRAPDGIIVSEDRTGYASSTKVLREAEVVVARSK